MILRELIAFADQGADAFFGEPELDTTDLLRVAEDGRGVISLVELPNLQDRPAVFSTFLMWLLADLFHELPEVGDPEKPSLVFFFDEAHLLFNDASKDFLAAITQTVRLIRSKGVGVVFVTQSPDRRARRRAGPARVAGAAPAARPHPARRQGAAGDGRDLPAQRLRRPRRGDHLAGDRRGDRDGDERARRSDPGGLDPAARPAVAHGARRPGRHGRDRDRLAAARDLRHRRSTGSRPARSSRPGSRRVPPRPRRSSRRPRPRPHRSRSASPTRSRRGRPRAREADSVVTEVLQSAAAKEFMRTAAREIARGVFGVGRR